MALIDIYSKEVINKVEKKNKKRVGGIWNKEKEGRKYMNMSLTFADIEQDNPYFAIYPNEHKQESGHPDFNVIQYQKI